VDGCDGCSSTVLPAWSFSATSLSDGANALEGCSVDQRSQRTRRCCSRTRHRCTPSGCGSQSSSPGSTRRSRSWTSERWRLDGSCVRCEQRDTSSSATRTSTFGSETGSRSAPSGDRDRRGRPGDAPSVRAALEDQRTDRPASPNASIDPSIGRAADRQSLYCPSCPRAGGGGEHGAPGPPSSSGLGFRPFKAATRVRIPLGARTTEYTRLWRSLVVLIALSRRRSRDRSPSAARDERRSGNGRRSSARPGSSVGRARG
jgi:hypothetical protein